jgi:hypothetical protein
VCNRLSIPIECELWSEDDGWEGLSRNPAVTVRGSSFEDAKKNMPTEYKPRSKKSYVTILRRVRGELPENLYCNVGRITSFVFLLYGPLSIELNKIDRLSGFLDPRTGFSSLSYFWELERDGNDRVQHYDRKGIRLWVVVRYFESWDRRSRSISRSHEKPWSLIRFLSLRSRKGKTFVQAATTRGVVVL